MRWTRSHKLAWLLLPAFLLGACTAAPATIVSPTLNPTSTVVPVSTETPAASFTSTPTQPPPNLPVFAAPVLLQVEFQDAVDGWGVAANGQGAILRTVDGGQTWLNATPTGAGQIGASTVLSILDTGHVWALVPGSDFYSATLFHTADGGQTWTSNPVPFGSAQIQFLDGSTGRALADRGAGAGSNAVGLYQTSDGGDTWTSVFHNDPTEPGASASLPLGGIKNGLTFLSPQTGWVTGSLPVAGNIYLYETVDGGHSWSPVAISLPIGYAQGMTLAHAPLFFGQDGLFPLTVNLLTSSVLTFYASHDGGLSWSGDPAAPNRSVPPGRYAFADSLHGWTWDGGARLYSTVDGAVTWQGQSTNLNLSGKIKQLDFAPAGGGSFTGWALTSLDENNHSSLYKTTDNGLTWTPLIP